MKHILILGAIGLSLSGCGTLPDRFGFGKKSSVDMPMTSAVAVPRATTIQDPALVPVVTAPRPPAAARTAEALDTTTPEQRAAAARPASEGAQPLGTTVASLGSATEPGLWMKTPLVQSELQGRVTNPATGKSSTVRLIPLEGPKTAGSRMSLSALRLIGASLTDLTSVEVSTGG